MYAYERLNHSRTAVYEDRCSLDPVDTFSAPDKIKKFKKGFNFQKFGVFVQSFDGMIGPHNSTSKEGREEGMTCLPIAPTQWASPRTLGSRLERRARQYFPSRDDLLRLLGSTLSALLPAGKLSPVAAPPLHRERLSGGCGDRDEDARIEFGRQARARLQSLDITTNSSLEGSLDGGSSSAAVIASPGARGRPDKILYTARRVRALSDFVSRSDGSHACRGMFSTFFSPYTPPHPTAGVEPRLATRRGQ